MQKENKNNNIQKLNTELLIYFKSNNVTNPSIELKENVLSLNKKILSYSTFVDITLMILLIFMIIAIDDLGYKILIFLTLAIIIYRLKIEFESINLLKISFDENKLIIIPKSILKKKMTVVFDDITSAEINLKFFQSMYRRFRIKIQLKNNKEVILIDFNIEKDAIFFLNYLKKTIKESGFITFRQVI